MSRPSASAIGEDLARYTRRRAELRRISLEGLQESVRRLNFDPERERLAVEAFLAGTRQRALLNDIVECIPELAEQLGRPDLDDRFAREPYLLMEVVPDLLLEAKAIRPDPEGATLLVFSQGLSMLIYAFIRALSCLFTWPGSNVEERATPQEVAKWVANQLSWATSIARRPGSLVFLPARRQITEAEELATAAERFVVCHEFAHYVSGHFLNARQRSIVFGDTEVKVAQHERDCEFEADQIGMATLLVVSGVKGLDYAAAYAGVELFLHLIRLMESFADSGQQETLGRPETHPAAKDRLVRIRDVVRSLGLPEEALHFAGEVDRMITELEPLILELSPKHPIEGMDMTRGDSYRRRTLDLLEACATDPLDWRRFSDQAWALLMECPAAVLEALRHAVKEEQTTLRKGRAPLPERVRALRHWSLISLFAMHLELDVRDRLDLEFPLPSGRVSPLIRG